MKPILLLVIIFFFQSANALSILSSLSVLKKSNSSMVLVTLSPETKEAPFGAFDERHVIEMLGHIKKAETNNNGYTVLIQSGRTPEKVLQTTQSQKKDLTDLLNSSSSFSFSYFIDCESAHVLSGLMKLFVFDDPRYFTRHFSETADSQESVSYRALCQECYKCELGTMSCEQITSLLGAEIKKLELYVKQCKEAPKKAPHTEDSLREALEQLVGTMKAYYKQLETLMERNAFAKDESMVELAERLWEVTMLSSSRVPLTYEEAQSKAKLREANSLKRIELYRIFGMLHTLFNQASLVRKIVELASLYPQRSFIVIVQESVAVPVSLILQNAGYQIEDDFYRGTSQNSQLTMVSRKSTSANSAPQSATTCNVQ